MRRNMFFVLPLLLATGFVLADDVPEDKPAPAASEDQAKKDEEKKKPAEQTAQELSGMSILGNQEAPKSLVIVPWRGSEPGATLGISLMLDDSKLPVDKDVFMRALSYYAIRSEKKP